MRTLQALFVACVLALVATYVLVAQQGGSQMTFFITSTGMEMAATSAVSPEPTNIVRRSRLPPGPAPGKWQAYLSTQGPGAVNARDRSARAPGRNAKGVVIAKSLDDLHGASNNLTKENAAD